MTELLTVPAPVSDDFDDDLVHAVCDVCTRALCDGGECARLGDVHPDDPMCVVCEDLEQTAPDCQFCGSPPT